MGVDGAWRTTDIPQGTKMKQPAQSAARAAAASSEGRRVVEEFERGERREQ